MVAEQDGGASEANKPGGCGTAGEAAARLDASAAPPDGSSAGARAVGLAERVRAVIAAHQDVLEALSDDSP